MGFSTSPSDRGTGRARVSSGVSARAGSSVLALPWAMTGVDTNRAAFTGEPRKLGGVFRSGVPSPASDEWSCHCTLRRDGEPEALSTEALSPPTLWDMLDATLEREDARWRAFVMRWRSVEAVAGDSAPRLSRWVGDPACDENAELGRLHDSRHTRVTAHPHPHSHTHTRSNTVPYRGDANGDASWDCACMPDPRATSHNPSALVLSGMTLVNTWRNTSSSGST